MRRFLSVPLMLMLFFMIGFVPVKSIAQNSAHDYQFSAGTMPFTPITGGTALTSIHGDDQYVTNIPIGFQFMFAGQTYSTVSISSNGWVSLASVSNSYLGNTLSNAQLADPIFFFYWDDLTGTGGNASYQTIGTSPNRIFVIQFLDWRRLSATGAMFDIQVRLHENGTVEYSYQSLV